jgi:hypothetical protein
VLFQGLGRLSEKVTVKVKPEDVPLNLRAHDVSTHSMTLSWSPPIRLNPINYKVNFYFKNNEKNKNYDQKNKIKINKDKFNNLDII